MVVETRLVTQPRGGGEYLEEFPAEVIRYSYRLNRPGSIEFTLPLDHAKTLRSNVEEGVHEAVVIRNEAVVWVGPILTIEEIDTPSSRVLSIRGEGLMGYMRRWHITSTLTFSNTEQLDIARSLISHHQNKAGGDFAIDTGSEASGVLRDRVYHGFELKNVYDALIQLSEVNNGFDFQIDPATRHFVPYYPRRGIRDASIVFDERNIRDYSRRRDHTSQASQVYAVGAGEGDDMLVANRQSSTAVARYGLLQAITSHKDVTNASTLNAHAQRGLDLLGSVPNLLSLRVSTNDPGLFSYNEGDEVRVHWSSPYAEVNEFQRLIGRDVEWESGEESVVLYMEPI